jgi:hypothetical protein
MRRRPAWWMAAAVLALAAACAAGVEEDPGDARRAESPSPPALITVTGEPVQGRTGPGGTSLEVALRTPGQRAAPARRIGTRGFALGLREDAPQLDQYPCTSCHVGTQQITDGERAGDVHANVEAVHPAETGASCGGCHAPDNVESFRLLTGERVGFDHAYRLCAQCHFPQVEAWAAGAHGKRLDGWQGRRVVMGCGECHDPHRPGLQARIPYPGPRLPGQRRGQ